MMMAAACVVVRLPPKDTTGTGVLGRVIVFVQFY